MEINPSRIHRAELDVTIDEAVMHAPAGSLIQMEGWVWHILDRTPLIPSGVLLMVRSAADAAGTFSVGQIALYPVVDQHLRGRLTVTCN